MKTTLTTTALCILLAAGSLRAAGIGLTPDPASGLVTGAPGQTVGWGFDLIPDATDWVTITGSVWLFETNASVGFYTDNIGFQGGPLAGFLAPAGPNWTQLFDPFILTGLGSFTIDPLAPIGAVDNATLRILFERYSGDPNTCGSCFLGGDSIDVPLGVAVAQTPEPGTLWLFAGVLLCCGAGFILRGASAPLFERSCLPSSGAKAPRRLKPAPPRAYPNGRL